MNAKMHTFDAHYLMTGVGHELGDHENVAFSSTLQVKEFDVIKDANYWFKDLLDRSARQFPALKLRI
ncbi:hypothetical protein DPMN_177792 [Dreissena polymorpha]|uniref:Uncharacterized protein n=1 Tax=Dreissena polymorpha TaxID=45954 RepID=A0A9D4EC96_DREPO|nr:hypothetical protein DPMN_177792 [Dreissena polymorpha]